MVFNSTISELQKWETPIFGVALNFLITDDQKNIPTCARAFSVTNGQEINHNMIVVPGLGIRLDFKVRRDDDFPLKKANRIWPYWGYLSRMSRNQT